MSGNSKVLILVTAASWLRGELTGWTFDDLSQIEFARQSPARRNQGIDIHRLKEAVQFLRGLQGARD